MTPSEDPSGQRILLVDDDDAGRGVMDELLQFNGFKVVAVASAAEALTCIATASFDVLITDLHMPNPGDGFTVISAMRHSQPEAVTVLLSGYPDVKSAMEAIILEADEIIVKPANIKHLADLVRGRLLLKKTARQPTKESVSTILQRCSDRIVNDWLQRVQKNRELNHLQLSDDERTGHLPKLIEDLVVPLNMHVTTTKDSDAAPSPAASEHGRLRHKQGYTPEMLVHESRILQVTLFGTLKDNMDALDFSSLLPDVMTIADEVDAQLTQSMGSYMALTRQKKSPQLIAV